MVQVVLVLVLEMIHILDEYEKYDFTVHILQPLLPGGFDYASGIGRCNMIIYSSDDIGIRFRCIGDWAFLWTVMPHCLKTHSVGLEEMFVTP